uniref:WW domain-containing protein C660.06-like n=1 Tax=Erigeron canadensis TaxID=72917 RepID=UPI001CB92A82|nr:WW domain-containing protein C660.06-like [Erigeron canadensis]
MDRVHKISLLLLTIIISFSSLAVSSDGRTQQLGNQNSKSGNKGETWSKGDDQNTIPRDLTSKDMSPGEESTGFAFDPYGLLAPMYFPASAAGFQDMEMVKDGHRSVEGVNGAPNFNGYLQGYDGAPGGGYGYPYPGGYGFPYSGGIGFPRGIFGFPRFRFPRRIFGFPRGFGGFPGGYGGFPGGYGGFPGGYGGFPGGYGGFPGGYGGNPGGYGGNPGGYGGKGPGEKHGDGEYPGSGGKAQVKGKEVNPHD